MGNPILLAVVAILVIVGLLVLFAGIFAIPALAAISVGGILNAVVVCVVLLVVAAIVYWLAYRV